MVDNSVQHDRSNNGGANTSLATMFNWSTIYDSTNDAYQSVVGITYNNNGGIYGARDGLYFGAAVVRTYDPGDFHAIDTFTAFQGGTVKVSNSGSIYGGDGTSSIPSGAGIDFGSGVGTAIVNNHASGAIEGPTGIYSEATGTKVTNAGSIIGSDFGIDLQGNAHGSVTNTGTIQGGERGIQINATSFTIRNTGTIEGNVSIAAQKISSVDNRGTLLGDAFLRGALTNSGDIDGDVVFKSDADTVRNSGFIEGTLTLAAGNDTYIASGSGHVGGAISGGAGADRLTGGSAEDVLRGDADRDVLRGGAGSDTFDFNTATDSGNTSSSRDVIADFHHGDDVIDVLDIDADSISAGNQNFSFLAAEGTGFTGVRGQLRYEQFDSANDASDRTVLYADLNGDKVSDFQIEFTGLITLTSSDFIL